jgi:hypothetical protein
LMDLIILLHGFLIFQECICNDVFFFFFKCHQENNSLVPPLY